jgi:hypothetical protein
MCRPYTDVQQKVCCSVAPGLVVVLIVLSSFVVAVVVAVMVVFVPAGPILPTCTLAAGQCVVCSNEHARDLWCLF